MARRDSSWSIAYVSRTMNPPDSGISLKSRSLRRNSGKDVDRYVRRRFFSIDDTLRARRGAARGDQEGRGGLAWAIEFLACSSSESPRDHTFLITRRSASASE